MPFRVDRKRTSVCMEGLLSFWLRGENTFAFKLTKRSRKGILKADLKRVS